MGKFVLVFLAAFVAAFFFLASVGNGQLLKRNRLPILATCPTDTMRCADSPAEKPHAAEPSLPISDQESSLSQRQGTVLEPLFGTGSKSPIGVLSPKVTHQLDPESLRSLKDLLSAARPSATVPITLPVESATSDRLSRLLAILEVLSLLVGVKFGGSLVAPWLPLVQRLVSGLASAAREPSPPRSPTPGEP